MAVIGITYLAAQLIAVAVGTTMSIIFGCTAAVLAIASLKMLSDKHRRVILPVLVASSIAFGIFAGYGLIKIEPAQRLYGQTIYVRGEIAKEPYFSNERYYYIIDTEYIQSTEQIQKTRIRISSKAPLEAEVTDIFEGSLKVNIPADNEPFSAASSRLSRGIMLTAYIPYAEEPIITEGRRGVKYHVSKAREAIDTRIDYLLDGDLSGMLKGVLLGDKSDMSTDLVSDFRICGLSHLLAVSGLHMSILVYVLTRLLRNLGVAYRPLAAIVLVFIWGYIALTGFSYSVYRAGIMTSMVLLARVINREADSLNSFGTALLVLCLVNPYAASDAGLLLSVSSSLGLILINGSVEEYVCSFINKKINDTYGLIKNAASTIVTSVVATICATPVLMLYFGELSIISPLANLLCLQLSTIFMVSGGLAVIASFLPFIGGILSRFIAVVTWISGKLIEFIVNALGSLPKASISVNYKFLPYFILCSAVLLLIYHFIFKENKIKGLCLCMGIVFFIFCSGVIVENIIRSNDRYFTVYSVGDGIAVAAVSGFDCAVVGTGGDRYSAWQMTMDMQDKNISTVDVLIYPDSSPEYASYADDFIECITPERIYLPEDIYISDELIYAVRNYSDALGGVSKVNYVSKNNKLTVTSYTDTEGMVWISIINGNMSLLVCPENGDCSLIPEDMRSPWCAVITSSDIANIGVLSPFSVIVSADEDVCAKTGALMLYRGVKHVFTTVEGNVVVSEKGAGICIGGE